MKKLLSLLLVGCMAVSMAACGGSSSSTPETSAPAPSGQSTEPSAPATPNDNPSESQPAATVEGDVIVIGGLAPLTGGVSQYGIASNNGTLLAVEEINAKGGVLGKQIKYIYEDEQGDPTEAINAYNKLVQSDNIVALVGDITTKPTIAVAQIAANDNIPMITPTATGESVTTFGPNIFRACFIDPYQGELMAHYANEKLSAKKVAVIYDNGDDYSSGVAEAFRDTATALGMEVVNYEGYSSGSDDFSALLTKIKEGGPDAVMVPTYYEDASKILTQARAIGIESTFLGSDGWDGILNQLDPSNYGILTNTYFCSQYSPQSDKPELQAFLTKYNTTYPTEANMFSVLGYDSMYMLATAIENAGSTDPDAVTAAMQALNYDGLTGVTTFDANRNPVREAYITMFEDGKSVVKETYSFTK